MTTSSLSANDLLMGGGVSAAKFPTIGTVVAGQIIREPEAREQTDFQTGATLRWDNGDPKMQIVVQLATNQRETGDDDGVRALYIKGGMLNAVRDAVRKSGAKGLEVGGTLAITYSGDGEASKRGFNPPKLYAATYTAPSSAAVSNVLAAGDAPTAPVSHVAPPAGIDPAFWATLPAEQQQALLAAHAGTR